MSGHMMMLFFAFLTYAVAAEESTSPLPSSQCPDNPAICLLDLLKSWEELRVSETNATNVLLPIVYYSKSSLLTLCESYSNLAERCGLEICHLDNPVASFVTRHFSFVCRKDVASKYVKNQQCISSTLISSKCTKLIKEEPIIGGELFCTKVGKYVQCIEEPLSASCGTEAYTLVMKAIEKYGCPSKIDAIKINESHSIGVESSAIEILENSEKNTTSIVSKHPDVSIIERTSLDVDKQQTTPVDLKEEIVSSNETLTQIEQFNTSTDASSTVLDVSTTVGSVEDEVIERNIVEGSGEAAEPETLHIVTVTEKSQTRRPKRKYFNAENMTDCYTSIVGDFGRFLLSSPTSSFIRFPLFGIKPMELEVLCAKFEVATECVDSLCVGNCRWPPIKSFVDAQLKEACAMRDMPYFGQEFSCLQTVLKGNTECIGFLNSTNPNRCDGHSQFRSCIMDRLLEECSEETVRLMDRMENGFGCMMLVENDIDEDLDGSGETVEGSASGDVPPVEGEEQIQEEPLLTRGVKWTPKTCIGSVKTSALSCLAPLLRLWTGIKANRKDTVAVFPIFEFSKVELLELCDAYANYRNCVQFTDSSICQTEPVINFAEEHFGQVCTTKQIEASIRTHDCINAIDAKSMATCQQFRKGETLPGKRKCTKVRHYTKCLRRLVSTSCGHLMLAQFDMIVHRFGC